MRYQTFAEYVAVREGLLLPDRPITPGGLKINPFPATQPSLGGVKVTKPKKPRSLLPIQFKPVQFKPLTVPKLKTPPKLKTVMPATAQSRWRTPASQS